jgi:hypothetical protein
MTDQHPEHSPEPMRGNGMGEYFPEKQTRATEKDKFPQPRGWSLQWDGSSISAIQEFNTRQDPPTMHNTCGDGSTAAAGQD